MAEEMLMAILYMVHVREHTNLFVCLLCVCLPKCLFVCFPDGPSICQYDCVCLCVCACMCACVHTSTCVHIMRAVATQKCSCMPFQQITQHFAS